MPTKARRLDLWAIATGAALSLPLLFVIPGPSEGWPGQLLAWGFLLGGVLLGLGAGGLVGRRLRARPALVAVAAVAAALAVSIAASGAATFSWSFYAPVSELPAVMLAPPTPDWFRAVVASIAMVGAVAIALRTAATAVVRGRVQRPQRADEVARR